MASATAAHLTVDRGEHPNYDVQMPKFEDAIPEELGAAIRRNCPQCRFMVGENVLGYASSWDPAQTVIWTPFSLSPQNDDDPLGWLSDFEYNYNYPPAPPPPGGGGGTDPAVPEPGSLSLLLVGAGAFVLLRRQSAGR